MQSKIALLAPAKRTFLLSILTVTMFASLTSAARAAGYENLPVVKPISACEDLAKIDISKVAEAPGTVKSAAMVQTEKGPFCKVIIDVDPALVVTTYLPAEHWTQRYYQGFGGFTMAGGCQPALNGEFAFGGANIMFGMVVNERSSTPIPPPDPQKLIDYTYRGNHVAAQVSKTLIKAYYGQAPHYSYFIGCSDGGRQALIESQRYPNDFDGVGAGSPAIVQTAEESTFHLWKYKSDRRADGTNILMPEKIKLLHDSVVAQCDTLSGVKDGLLQDPSNCHFDPASMKCPSGATDTFSCFTAEEVSAIQDLYEGAHDDQGNHFYFGMEPGSEELWPLPKTPTQAPTDAATHALQLAYMVLPEVTPALYNDYRLVTFTQADFERASVRAPLYNAANTDLKAFAAHGGKLILWHGLADPQIPPAATMAYYQGVQKFMGAEATDKFLRAFFPPGVGHCGGGDGYTQLDVLSALMAWVEMKQAPTEIIAGKTAPRAGQGGGGRGGAQAGGQGGPQAGGPGGPQGGPQAGGQGGGRGGAQGANQPRQERPFASPDPTLIATRPLYPYPYIAHYDGKGDPNDASSYMRATSPAKTTQTVNYEALKLIGPDNQHTYEVKDGRLAVANQH